MHVPNSQLRRYGIFGAEEVVEGPEYIPELLDTSPLVYSTGPRKAGTIEMDPETITASPGSWAIVVTGMAALGLIWLANR